MSTAQPTAAGSFPLPLQPIRTPPSPECIHAENYCRDRSLQLSGNLLGLYAGLEHCTQFIVVSLGPALVVWLRSGHLDFAFDRFGFTTRRFTPAGF